PAFGAGVPLTEALAGRQLLLVLDNCEHLAAAAADLCMALLLAADEVRVLATSREPLGVPGEARYRLPPLELPGPGGPAGVAGSEAVVLFVDRARRGRPPFALGGGAGPGGGGVAGRPGGGARGVARARGRGWRRWACGSCWTGWMTGSGCRWAGSGGRRRGTGRWRRRWTGATGC